MLSRFVKLILRPVHYGLDALSKRIVKAIRPGLLWKFTGNYWVFKPYPRVKLQANMVLHYPKGGWSWWRLLEIMGWRLPLWLMPETYPERQWWKTIERLH